MIKQGTQNDKEEQGSSKERKEKKKKKNKNNRKPHVLFKHVYFSLGKNVNPITGCQLFDAEIHSFLIHTGTSDHGDAFAQHKEVRVPDVCETNVVGRERPPHLTSIHQTLQVQGR